MNVLSTIGYGKILIATCRINELCGALTVAFPKFENASFVLVRIRTSFQITAPHATAATAAERIVHA
jgi:hypothetical protein